MADATGKIPTVTQKLDLVKKILESLSHQNNVSTWSLKNVQLQQQLTLLTEEVPVVEIVPASGELKLIFKKQPTQEDRKTNHVISTTFPNEQV